MRRIAGEHLVKLKRFEEALAAAERLLELQRGSTRGLLIQGAALCGMSRFSEALVSFQHVQRKPRIDAEGELKYDGFCGPSNEPMSTDARQAAKGVELCARFAETCPASVSESKSGRYPSTPHLPFSPQVRNCTRRY